MWLVDKGDVVFYVLQLTLNPTLGKNGIAFSMTQRS